MNPSTFQKFLNSIHKASWHFIKHSQKNFTHLSLWSLSLSKWYSIIIAQLLSHVWLCDPMDQAFLSFILSWSLLKFMSVDSVRPSNYLILCHPLLLPSIIPSIRVFSNELALHSKWLKSWNFKDIKQYGFRRVDPTGSQPKAYGCKILGYISCVL